jgi:hypothetical protein
MSSQQSYIKLTTNGNSFSRINTPSNYNDLKNIINQKFKDNIKDNIDIQFINLQNKTKITNKEEYEKSIANKGTIKLQVLFQEKQIQPPTKVVDIIDAFNKNNNLSQHNKNNEHVCDNVSLQNIITDTVNTKLQSVQHELVNELLTKISNLHQPIQQQQQHKQQQEVKHIGITCSNCKQPNIVGIRYKCIKCNNYNLCETCENLCIHDIHHILLKIRLPINDNELPK